MPQFAPLLTATAIAAALAAQAPSLAQASGSFRVGSAPKISSEHLTQPQFSWLRDVLALPDVDQSTVAERIAATQSASNSFRARDAKKLDYYRYLTQPDMAGWGASVHTFAHHRAGRGPGLDLIRRKGFREYLEQPQQTPLYFVPTLEVLTTEQQIGAILEQKNSFRSDNPKTLNKYYHTLQPQDTPTWFKPAIEPTIAIWVPVFQQQAKSFRAAKRQVFDNRLNTELQISWLKGPAGLSDEIELSAIQAALSQLASSFRAPEAKKLFIGHLYQRTVSILLFEPKKLVPIFDQQWNTFRARDGRRIDYRQVKQPDYGWLVEGIDELKRLVPPLDQLARSFIAPPGRKLTSAHLTQPQIAWLKEVLSLGEPIDKALLAGVWQLQTESFRAGDTLKLNPVLLTQPQLAWLKDVLDLEDVGDVDLLRLLTLMGAGY